jgi:hypothetical protein
MPKKIKTIKKAKKSSFFFKKYRDIITNSELSINNKIQILSFETLRRNYRFVLINTPTVYQKRLEEHYDKKLIMYHIQYRDPSGETIGCGCTLCRVRHMEWKAQQELNKVNRIIKLYSSTIEASNPKKYGTVKSFSYFYNTGLEDYMRSEHNKIAILPDRGEYLTVNFDPFAEELFIRKPLVRMYHHNPNFFTSRLEVLSEQQSILKQKYETRKRGRILLATKLAIPC